MQINDIITLEKDQYQLIEAQIGGAQAYVFKVRRVRDQRLLAVKIARIWKKPNVLLPMTRVNANCKRIQQEIDFLQALEEPEAHYIVACLDASTLRQGQKSVPAFVMPFYDQPLSKVLLAEQQPTLARHLAWIQQMIIALKYIHHHHKDGEALVHRDFKLDNLMLTEKDEIRLLDFGISKQVFRSTDSAHTKMNYSADCVAPEQILLIKPNTDGKKHVAIGTHTDIYALGLLIYRLIAGHLPESHETFIMNLEEISQQHREALNKGETGLLGKVGGITAQETEFLVQSFIDLAEGIPVTFLYDDEDEMFDDETLLQTDSVYQGLAERFAEFVAELLDKRYQARPNAKSALYWIENIQFKLNALDKNKQTTPSATESTKPVTGGSAAVSAVHEDDGDDKTVIMPSRYRPPMPLPPLTSPSKKTERIAVLPEQKDRQTGQKTKVQDVPIIPAGWSLKTLLVIVGVGLLALGTWLFMRPESETLIPTPAPSINIEVNATQNSTIESPVYNDTNTPSYRPSETIRPPNASKATLGDDSKKWAEVIPKLKRLAQQGNGEAAALLAHAYHYGKGGQIEWGKAWNYYQQALQQDSQANDKTKLERQQHVLEVNANRILADSKSSISQRKKAYQLIETIARQEVIPLSINARLWMEYRYRTGDGVAVNTARADAWKKKYNAIKDKRP